MTDISKLSTEELEAELEKRKQEEALNSIPKPLKDINIDAIKNIAREELEYVTKYGESSKDIEHWMYETVMTSVYGDNIFNYINSKM